jgi:glyoxylase-like metal-dependent hydrolase (beta-lactamase superfamily II)
VKESTLGKFPGHFVLIKHPAAGYILYDVGEYNPDDRPDFWNEFIYLEVDEEGLLDRQLAKQGISVDDISAIIISHMHCDHANGLHFFSGTQAGQNVFFSKADFMEGCAVALSHDNQKYTESPYWRSIMKIPGITYHFIEEETELFPGVHLILLEGHTPCVIGLLLRLESGYYLFPNDACGSKLNYGPPARQPGIIYDTLGYQRTVKRLYSLQKKYDAKIIFSHDLADDETYLHFPEFYK